MCKVFRRKNQKRPSKNNATYWIEATCVKSRDSVRFSDKNEGASVVSAWVPVTNRTVT